MTEYDLTLMSEECQTEGWGICHWNIFPYAGVDETWKLYLTYLAAMYTFQNLNTGINDKVWPDLDLGRRSNWGRGVYYWKVLL